MGLNHDQPMQFWQSEEGMRTLMSAKSSACQRQPEQPASYSAAALYTDDSEILDNVTNLPDMSPLAATEAEENNDASTAILKSIVGQGIKSDWAYGPESDTDFSPLHLALPPPNWHSCSTQLPMNDRSTQPSEAAHADTSTSVETSKPPEGGVLYDEKGFSVSISSEGLTQHPASAGLQQNLAAQSLKSSLNNDQPPHSLKDLQLVDSVSHCDFKRKARRPRERKARRSATAAAIVSPPRDPAAQNLEKSSNNEESLHSPGNLQLVDSVSHCDYIMVSIPWERKATRSEAVTAIVSTQQDLAQAQSLKQSSNAEEPPHRPKDLQLTDSTSPCHHDIGPPQRTVGIQSTASATSTPQQEDLAQAQNLDERFTITEESLDRIRDLQLVDSVSHSCCKRSGGLRVRETTRSAAKAMVKKMFRRKS